MNKKDWSNQIQEDPWDPRYYQTGYTEPPRGRGGLIAVLLVAVILLGGISSALGIMNIKLFRQVNGDEQAKTPVQFSENLPDPSISETAPTEEAASDITLELNTAPLGTENVPQSSGLSLQSIYEKALPSVVSITCQTAGGTSTGTGVVIAGEGYIVTNCHVVENAQSIAVLFSDNTTAPALSVGTDAISDLAVLYVEGKTLTPAEFGDSSNLRVGDAVAAIGDPLGTALRGTMTDGIVSAINRDITTDGRTMTLIQTNAALNSGNSGGPLLNCYGQVVGINTMKIGDNMNVEGVEGLGFAIPSTTVKEVVDQLIRQGYVSGRPSLGITGETVSAFLQHYYRLPQGVYITNVTYGSTAYKAGLEAGDILTTFNETRITNAEALTTALYGCQAGDTVQLGIYRGGRQYAVTLTVDQAN